MFCVFTLRLTWPPTGSKYLIKFVVPLIKIIGILLTKSHHTIIIQSIVFCFIWYLGLKSLIICQQFHWHLRETPHFMNPKEILSTRTYVANKSVQPFSTYSWGTYKLLRKILYTVPVNAAYASGKWGLRSGIISDAAISDCTSEYWWHHASVIVRRWFRHSGFPKSFMVLVIRRARTMISMAF